MFYVTRKATDEVVGRKVPEESLDLYLSVLPAGVYGVEDSDGNELNVVTVSHGRISYAEHHGRRPEETVLSNGAVVTF
jgi:hypothetical protein